MPHRGQQWGKSTHTAERNARPLREATQYLTVKAWRAREQSRSDEVKQPSITLDVRVDIHQAVAIEESNMLALVDGRPARMQRLGLLPISA